MVFVNNTQKKKFYHLLYCVYTVIHSNVWKYIPYQGRLLRRCGVLVLCRYTRSISILVQYTFRPPVPGLNLGPAGPPQSAV